MSYLTVSIKDDFSTALQQKLANASEKATHGLATIILADTERFVPAITLSLSNRAQVMDGQIIYPGPYARYLYYGKVMVDAQTGKGPMRIVSKDGSEVIRFRKGATLKPTNRPLKYTKTVHKDATDHWFEASKAKNLDMWIYQAGKLVKRYV